MVSQNTKTMKASLINTSMCETFYTVSKMLLELNCFTLLASLILQIHMSGLFVKMERRPITIKHVGQME